jgi:hypothetical protein
MDLSCQASNSRLEPSTLSMLMKPGMYGVVTLASARRAVGAIHICLVCYGSLPMMRQIPGKAARKSSDSSWPGDG